MIHTIKNEYLQVRINSIGAELWSIQDQEGTEYLWQGDEIYWKSRAVNIFPYVARLTEGRYFYRGKEYFLGNHGFVRHMELTVQEQCDHAITLTLASCAETLAQYPFPFRYSVHYELVERDLLITYEVENTGDDVMYFGIGGHPGFRIPIREGEAFEDYYLDFQKPCHPIRIGFTEKNFVSGEEVPYPLQEDQYLPLTHQMFDQEIILLKQSAKQVQFRNRNGKDGVMVSCPDMPYIGIWHKDHTDAPYVCIEPWASLPAHDGSKVDLEQQADLIRLEARRTYTNRWSIRLHHNNG